MNLETFPGDQMLSLDLGDLENGIYILVATTGDRIIKDKIVKQSLKKP